MHNAFVNLKKILFGNKNLVKTNSNNCNNNIIIPVKQDGTKISLEQGLQIAENIILAGNPAKIVKRLIDCSFYYPKHYFANTTK